MARRTPKNYDGTKVTTHQIRDVLYELKFKVDAARQKQPQEILNAWPALVGPLHAKMTRAESFRDGMLFIKVSNSTLYSLLCKYEKDTLLAKLKEQFPESGIYQIQFRIG